MEGSDKVRKKYQMGVPKTVQIDELEKEIHEVAYNVRFTCDDCRRMQEEGHSQENIRESNITKKHMVKKDCGVLSRHAATYGAPDLEKDADDFALNYCGTGNKEDCDKGRKLFVVPEDGNGIYETIKERLREAREKRNQGKPGY